MKPLHSLLKRQIKKFFPNEQVPQDMREFVDAVDQAYHEFDQDRSMLERSLEYSSQELFLANADIRALFEAFPDVLFRINRDGTILDCRAGKSANLYLPSAEMIGRKIQEGFPKKKTLFEEKMREVFETGKISSFEYELIVNESVRFFEARLIRFLEDQLMVVVRNIDERRKMESQLLQFQKMESVGRLAAGVAHEINNPMAVILGFSQSLTRQIVPGSPMEMPLKSIEREALRCKQFVQSLLTFSRAGKIDEQRLDVSPSVENALSLIAAQAKIKQVQLETRLSPNLPFVVANSGNLQQILINLCNNALDAMAPGGTLTVSTRTVRMEGRDWVEIGVQDTGIGIPAAVQSRIFEPFFTTKDPGKGTGLGLSLVYELVQRHSGKIDFESTEGKGTFFRVMFPAAV